MNFLPNELANLTQEQKATYYYSPEIKVTKKEIIKEQAKQHAALTLKNLELMQRLEGLFNAVMCLDVNISGNLLKELDACQELLSAK